MSKYNFVDAPNRSQLGSGKWRGMLAHNPNVSEDIIKVIKSPEAGAQGIGAAVQNILLAATEMGYGTCYLTGPSHAKPEIEEIIAFEKPEYTLMSLVSLGIPADETPEKPIRKPLEEVITFIE